MIERLTVTELAARTKTPVSSIKFFVRERLLPRGDLRAAHRAFYDASHVRRVLVVRALRETAGLPIASIRRICRLLDGAHGDVASVVAHVIDAVARPAGPAARGPRVSRARREVLALLRKRGVRVRRDARSVRDLALALVRLRETIGDVPASALTPYLDAMLALARRDFRANRHLVVDAASAAYGATIATVLWEPVLVLLRRVAHEHTANLIFAERG